MEIVGKEYIGRLHALLWRCRLVELSFSQLSNGYVPCSESYSTVGDRNREAERVLCARGVGPLLRPDINNAPILSLLNQ
jgi:hypothetical protein